MSWDSMVQTRVHCLWFGTDSGYLPVVTIVTTRPLPLLLCRSLVHCKSYQRMKLLNTPMLLGLTLLPYIRFKLRLGILRCSNIWFMHNIRLLFHLQKLKIGLKSPPKFVLMTQLATSKLTVGTLLYYFQHKCYQNY